MLGEKDGKKNVFLIKKKSLKYLELQTLGAWYMSNMLTICPLSCNYDLHNIHDNHNLMRRF